LSVGLTPIWAAISSLEYRPPVRFALENGEHETHGVLMTRNQALLLAKYLLDATQQTLPKPVKPSLWRKVAKSIR